MPKTTNSKAKAQAIQFRTSAENASKIDQVAKKLRTNRAGVAELATETLSELIINGGASVVNGRVEFHAPKAA